MAIKPWQIALLPILLLSCTVVTYQRMKGLKEHISDYKGITKIDTVYNELGGVHRVIHYHNIVRKSKAKDLK